MATKQGKCHEGPCGPCSLCQQRRTRYTHPDKLTQDEYLLLVTVNCSPVKKDAFICYSCIKQLKRNMGNPHFQSRWKCKPFQEKGKCFVDRCKYTKLASANDIEEILQRKIVYFTVDEQVEASVGLCKEHYNALYTSLHSSRSCESCKVKPHAGQILNRHCPSPEIVNTYLKLVSNERSTLSSESLVCTSCYKHFCATVDNVNNDSIQQLSKVTEHLNQDDKQELNKVISSLTAQSQKLILTTGSDLFEYAILKVGVSLGELMIAGEATSPV